MRESKQDYAKEELRAEIASMMIGQTIGIGHDPAQHAAYVDSWIKTLQDDSMEIIRAAKDAEKIHGFVLDLEREVEQGTSNEARVQAQQNFYSTQLGQLEQISEIEMEF